MLFDIYTLTGLIFVISCYTFPYVFVLLANALDRIPGDLEDASAMLGAPAWRTAWRITIPLALPALAAGALVAFLQAMTLFGSPAILALPAGFHTMTTKIWSLFQYPPKPELAAAASLPLLILTIILLRAQALVLGRRGYTVIGGRSGAPRLVPLRALRWPAFALCLAVLSLPVFLPYGALLNAAFSRVASQLLSPATMTLHNFNFVFFELSATKLAMKNTFLLGAMAATCGTALALVIAYLNARAAIAGHRVLAFLATAPIAIPGIVLGVGLFLAYTRGPIVLYGTLWILLLAYVTIELPAAFQQLRASFHAVSPELEEASSHPRRHAAADAARRHRPAARAQLDRHLVLYFRGRGARALRRRDPLHLRDEGALRPHLRSQGERRSRRHRRSRPHHADPHRHRRRRRQPSPRLLGHPPAQQLIDRGRIHFPQS